MNPFNRLFRRPPTGEQTRLQGIAQAGVAFAQLPGFAPPLPGTYAVYRRMSAHPTLALAKSIVTAPILAGSWSYETRRPDGRPPRRAPLTDGPQSDPIDRELEHRADFLRRQLDPLRPAFLAEALRALEFGWRPFEKIFSIKNNQITLTNLKPLLPDFTFIQVDDHGHFAGLTQLDTQLTPDKSFIYTHDGEAGNLYGRSRHENARHVYSAWLSVDERTAQLTTKIAAIIPLVHYPLGQSRDPAGQLRDNGDLADIILHGLGSGRGVKLPNLFATSDDPRLTGDLAGKSSWVISFLEATHASANIQGLTDRQRYYDVLMFRSWLRPERTGIESRYGSRADAHTHTDTAITETELLHADICAQLNHQVIDELLTLNFGEGAPGSVYLAPAPLRDSKRDVFQKLLEAMWKDPATLGQFLKQTDLDAVLEVMQIPTT
jgi:hypothetical protein